MATFVPPQQSSPVDYHNSLADVDSGNSALEMQAFEKGRMQGEMEAARRYEAESQHKTFQQDTTVVQNVIAQPDVVEINRLTFVQKMAAVFGELLSAGYIVLMAIWLAQYNDGGVEWISGRDQNGSRGMFNVHILTSFIGLWFVSQAYLTYRLLPVNTPAMLNKLWYVFCHAAALGCFALTIAAAVMSNPHSSRSWSMHAWTSYLAVAVYAVHAIYSSFKVMMKRHGVDAHNWNETPANRSHMTPEQRRDAELNTVYRAGPGAMLDNNRNIDVNARNAATHSGAGPHWSERTIVREHLFLIPRAKWAVVSLFGLMASILIGLGEFEMSSAINNSAWARGDDNGENQGRKDESSDFAKWVGAIGIVTMAAVMLVGYAAMPPRTTLAHGTTGVVENRRTSISTGSTAPNTQYGQSIEVV